jgi:hypothetical protein
MHVFDQVIEVIKMETRIQNKKFVLAPAPEIHLPFTTAVSLYGQRACWIIGWEPVNQVVEVLGIMVLDPRTENANSIGKAIVSEFASVNEHSPTPPDWYGANSQMTGPTNGGPLK